VWFVADDVWQAEGRLEVAVAWCALLPQLSTDFADDLTGIANDYERASEILERYRARLAGLCPNGVGTGLTGLSVWSPLSACERSAGRRLLFGLSRGVPSGLSPSTGEESNRVQLDFALLISVRDESDLPRGPLFLEGVPLVVHVHGPGSNRPLSPISPAAEPANRPAAA
jgi:hypothetical protein